MAAKIPTRTPTGEIVNFICLVGSDGLPVDFPSGLVPSGIPLGFQTLQPADLSAAIGLTIPLGTKVVICQAESGDVRWRVDGVAPTATTGFLIGSGTNQNFIANLEDVQFIASLNQAGAKLNIGYYSS